MQDDTIDQALGGRLEVLILVGGRGTRMQTSTDPRIRSYPKALLRIRHKGAVLTILDYLVNELTTRGFKRIVLLAGTAAGHSGAAIKSHVDEYYRNARCPDVWLEPTPLGGGGAVSAAVGRTDADLLVVIPGDIVFPFNRLACAVRHHINVGLPITWVVTSVAGQSAQNTGRIVTDPARTRVLESFEGVAGPKVAATCDGTATATSTGVVILSRKPVAALFATYYRMHDHPRVVDLYEEFIPWALTVAECVAAFDIAHPVVDLGTPERVAPYLAEGADTTAE